MAPAGHAHWVRLYKRDVAKEPGPASYANGRSMEGLGVVKKRGPSSVT